uniref:Uncharacterized protein n=1 Tax=Peronospora matthiolae TaxID=2874970 RepID=A0AAV1VDD4_9STRA
MSVRIPSENDELLCSQFLHKMLRRHPTRVEERADVAAEYESYLQEKERNAKSTSSSTSSRLQPPVLTFPPSPPSGAASDSIAARQEARRQDVRTRIGLNRST